MTRKKTKLEFIEDDYSRKTCFRKRKKSLLKKMEEISTLCGIQACAVIYSPYDAEPEAWPDKDEARALVGRFRSLPHMEQTKKMMNHDEFLKARISTLEEQLKKLQLSNREKKLKQVMYSCLTGASFHGLGLADMVDLDSAIDQAIADVKKSIENRGNINVIHEYDHQLMPPSMLPLREMVNLQQQQQQANDFHDQGVNVGFGIGGGGSSSMENPMQSWIVMPDQYYHGQNLNMAGTYEDACSAYGLINNNMHHVPFAAPSCDEPAAAAGPSHGYNSVDPMWPHMDMASFHRQL
ncbi:hypothetical protein Dimus_021626 [Dionaea muscipula]